MRCIDEIRTFKSLARFIIKRFVFSGTDWSTLFAFSAVIDGLDRPDFDVCIFIIIDTTVAESLKFPRVKNQKPPTGIPSALFRFKKLIYINELIE